VELVSHRIKLVTGIRIADIYQGPHTDYGLIALTAQDSNGGLWVAPPCGTTSSDEKQHDLCRNNEDSGTWNYVPPVENTLAVFPGDMMSYITSGYVPATLHKVNLSNAERFSWAYFHEAAFKSE
jgi:2-oxoglutarate dioxygenase / 2-oxoglutarate/L-arginine monooxygenase/decarboxylase